MKKIITILAVLLFTAIVFAQAPQKMSYQAVIRNSSDVLVTNTQIGMEINIRQGSPTGTIVYTEIQTPTTNANGLVSIEIGGGIGFDTINWANGTYFIETKTAVVPPLTTYTITGTSQLLSVPYALHAKTAESLTGTIIDTSIWKKNGNDIYYNNGNVGIQTLSPYASLSISAGGYTGDNLLLTCPSGSGGQPTLRLYDGNTTSLGFNLRQVGQSLIIDHRQSLDTVNSVMVFNYGNKMISSWLPFEIDNLYASTEPLLRLRQPGNSPNLPFRMIFQGPVGTACWYVGGGDSNGNFQVTRTCSTTDTPVIHIDKDNLNVGIGTTVSKSKLTVSGGDINVLDIGSGIIMKSPNGQCWRVTVDNSGNFVSTAITCP